RMDKDFFLVDITDPGHDLAHFLALGASQLLVFGDQKMALMAESSPAFLSRLTRSRNDMRPPVVPKMLSRTGDSLKSPRKRNTAILALGASAFFSSSSSARAMPRPARQTARPRANEHFTVSRNMRDLPGNKKTGKPPAGSSRLARVHLTAGRPQAV